MGARVVVSGYATVDYVAWVPEPLRNAATVVLKGVDDGRPWPRPGGAVLYTARALAAAGCDAVAVSRVGGDDHGGRLLAAFEESGIHAGGIVREGGRTPWCLLLHHRDGACTCFIDYGSVDAASVALTEAQRELLRSARAVCVAAGPSDFTAAVLDAVPTHVPMAWIVKADDHAFPPDLAAMLAARSRFIFCNAGERLRVDAARARAALPDQWIIETRGAEGVLAERANERLLVAAEPLEIRDTTGAGDTFAGAALATLLTGNDGMEEALRHGMAAARRLLCDR